MPCEADYFEDHRESGCLGLCGLCGDVVMFPSPCGECADRRYVRAVPHDYHGWICSHHTDADLLAAADANCAVCGQMLRASATLLRRGRLMHFRCAALKPGQPVTGEVPYEKDHLHNTRGG